METPILKIHTRDNLIVALVDLDPGQRVIWEDEEFIVKESIPAKHKFTAEDLLVGSEMYLYGVLVGVAIKDIQKGRAITVENTVHAVSDIGERKRNVPWSSPDTSRFIDRTFSGYHRNDGKVGTANLWLVFPLVFCENHTIETIRRLLLGKLGYADGIQQPFDIQKLIDTYREDGSIDSIRDTDLIVNQEINKQDRIFRNVDGIKFITHDGGCGGTRQDSQTLCALLAGYVNNANVAGATVLSLGCQHAQVELLREAIKKINPDFNKPLYVVGRQESKSENDFIANAVKQTFKGLIHVNEIERKPADLEKLIVGLECGGSDGFSGVSANPSLGYFSDLLVGMGGSVILSEFPELNGVENELVNRCIDDEDALKFVDLMGIYNKRAHEVGSGFENNPSPGNIKDGLITDAIKSAGAAKKGGTSPVVDVLDYTEQVTKNGLNLLCTPGNDVESTTGLAGSGATITLFTTGLGTATGNPVSPVVKISSNSHLAHKMSDIIDIDAGTIITGQDSIKSKGEEIMEFVIELASGKRTTRSMESGQDDFIPWKRGISL